MILVDSSVWIDYFRGTATKEADRLDALLGRHELAVADIVLTEVLQGFDKEADFRLALGLMDSMPVITISGRETAVAAAQNFSTLRVRGITVRKTIDTLIATYCILNDAKLLFSDRDFDPFVAYLGLQSAFGEP